MWPFSRHSETAPQARIEPVFNVSPENPSTSLANPASWLTDITGGGPSYAGPSVSATSAMRVTAVYRCVSLKAGIIATLPLQVFKRTDSGRELATSHRLYRLLHDEPNEMMSAFIWKEMISANLDMRGNHYSLIETDNANRIIGILPLDATAVEPVRIGGRVRYRYIGRGFEEWFDSDKIIHVPGLGFDGIKGVSPIEYAARQAIGLGMAMEQHVGAMHKNGVNPSIAVEVGPKLSPDGMKRMRTEFNGLYAGSGNAGKAVFIENGSKIEPITMSLADAQTLENRRFQIADIARAFGVPLHILGETEKATSWGTGIEQLAIGFQKTTLDPILCRIEGELNRKVVSDPYYCEFNRNALNAMDAKTQSELFASGVMNAAYTPNEVRRRLNLPDMDGGDVLYIQSGTVPLTASGQQQQPSTEPLEPA